MVYGCCYCYDLCMLCVCNVYTLWLVRGMCVVVCGWCWCYDLSVLCISCRLCVVCVLPFVYSGTCGSVAARDLCLCGVYVLIFVCGMYVLIFVCGYDMICVRGIL